MICYLPIVRDFLNCFSLTSRICKCNFLLEPHFFIEENEDVQYSLFPFSLLFGNWGVSGELEKYLQDLHGLFTDLDHWPIESISFDAQVSGF